MKNATNTATHKNEEGRITAMNTRKRHDGEHEYRTNITKLTLDHKKNLLNFNIRCLIENITCVCSHWSTAGNDTMRK